MIIQTFTLVSIWSWILILLVTLKIRSHILFKTTAMKSAVKCEIFCTAKVVLACVITNEEHSTEFCLAQSCVVVKWNFILKVVTMRKVKAKRRKNLWTLKLLIVLKCLVWMEIKNWLTSAFQANVKTFFINFNS